MKRPLQLAELRKRPRRVLNVFLLLYSQYLTLWRHGKTANCFPLLYAIVGTIMPLIALKRTVTGGKQSLSTNKGSGSGERLGQKLKFQII